MERRKWAVFLLTAACLLELVASADAVIKLEIPMAKHYEVSKLVLVGTIAAVHAESRVLDVKADEAIRGDWPASQFRIQIAAPAEFIKRVAAGGPVVLFQQQRLAAVHVADTWLQATPVPGANAWRVVQLFENLNPTYPGRTEALVRLVKEFKAGNRPILDRWDRKPFAGGIRQRAKLAVQGPVWLLAADVNGDKKPDLLVGSAAGGTRLFSATESGYELAKDFSGGWGAAGGYHAAGDIDGDGRNDLLLDDTLWINDGRQFKPLKNRLDTGKGRPLAAALVDVSGDRRPDAVLLSADGELRVFENPGPADRPWTARPIKTLWKEGPAPAAAAFGDWGDTGKPHAIVFGRADITRYALDSAGGPPADLGRLTGMNLRKSARWRDGPKCAAGIALDMDGDRRTDVLALGAEGAILMVNRGYGTFLMDDNAGAAITGEARLPSPFRAMPGAVYATADLHGHGCDDLLVLTADGTLFELDNGPR